MEVKHMFRLALCLFLLCTLSLAALAQTKRPARSGRAKPALKDDSRSDVPPPPPALKDNSVKPTQGSTPDKKKVANSEDDVVMVDTDLVTTPVSVLDRNGRFIPGLRKKDFKIFENGIQQKITYFQSEEKPFTVILMIDASPSTRYKMDDIHFAAVTFLNQLRPDDKVMVVAFDSRVRLFTPEPTSDRKELFAAIYKAQFGSGTSLYDAVEAVVSLDQLKIPGRKAVVMFTDGVDTTSRYANLESTLEEVEETDALIYPIRYDTQASMANGGSGGSGPIDLTAMLGGNAPRGMIIAGRGQSSGEYERGRKYLQGLADNSGGRLFEADTIENLEASFSGVAEELRRQYSVGYYPDGTGQPGERRKVKIEIVAKPNAIVRAKSTYVIRRERSTESAPASVN